MYSFGGTKRSAGQAFPNLPAHKQRKTKILKPGLPKFAQAPVRKLQFAPKRIIAPPPSARKSIKAGRRLVTAKPSRPLPVKQLKQAPTPSFRPPNLNVQVNGGLGVPTFGSTNGAKRVLSGGFGGSPPQLAKTTRTLNKPNVVPVATKVNTSLAQPPPLTGGFGTKRVAIPSKPFSPPRAIPSRTAALHTPSRTMPTSSLHVPNLSGPTTLLPPPSAPRKYPDWVYDEKGGVLRFDENIIVYHIKGFPLCPWQDLVREGPLDPKWDENKAEIARIQADEKANASEPEDEEDDAYVPPGSSQPVPHRKRSTRRSNNNKSAARIVNKNAYYDASEGGIAENVYPGSKSGKRRRVIKIQKHDSNRQAPKPTRQRKPAKKQFKWIQCIFCNKWRKIPATIPNATLGEQWACRDNFWDQAHNSCRDPQELESDTEDEPDAPPTLPTYGYQGFRKEPTPTRQHKQLPAARTPRTPKQAFSVDEHLNQFRSQGDEYDASREEFYKNLQNFLGEVPPITTLCQRPVDLYHLYSQVTSRGGYDTVTENKQWREIFRALDNYNASHTSASYALKKCYTKILGDYERQHYFGY